MHIHFLLNTFLNEFLDIHFRFNSMKTNTPNVKSKKSEQEENALFSYQMWSNRRTASYGTVSLHSHIECGRKRL